MVIRLLSPSPHSVPKDTQGRNACFQRRRVFNHLVHRVLQEQLGAAAVKIVRNNVRAVQSKIPEPH